MVCFSREPRGGGSIPRRSRTRWMTYRGNCLGGVDPKRPFVPVPALGAWLDQTYILMPHTPTSLAGSRSTEGNLLHALSASVSSDPPPADPPLFHRFHVLLLLLPGPAGHACPRDLARRQAGVQVPKDPRVHQTTTTFKIPSTTPRIDGHLTLLACVQSRRCWASASRAPRMCSPPLPRSNPTTFPTNTAASACRCVRVTLLVSYCGDSPTESNRRRVQVQTNDATATASKGID